MAGQFTDSRHEALPPDHRCTLRSCCRACWLAAGWKFAQKVAQQIEESGCHAVPPQYGDTEKQNTDESYAQYRYPQGRLNHHFYADFTIGGIAVFLNHPLIFSNKQKLDSPTEAFAPILLQTKTLIFSFSDHSTLQAKIRDPETCLAWIGTIYRWGSSFIFKVFFVPSRHENRGWLRHLSEDYWESK